MPFAEYDNENDKAVFWPENANPRITASGDHSSV